MSTDNGNHKWDLTFMAFFAHPDDEVFSCGGVMILNKQRGIRNVLICATKGEAGEFWSPEMATAATLGTVREQELITAASYMGVDDLFFLGYRDSGMVDSEDNQNPAAYTNADDSAVIARLVSFIREYRPQVAITFDPSGGYGHPDHLAIHRHTLAAIPAAADPVYAPELGAPWQVQRLYYPAFRGDWIEALNEQLISQGLPPPEWGLDQEELEEQPIHATVDVTAVASSKWAAFKSHNTQFGPTHPFMQVPEEFLLKKMLVKEYFELAKPDTKPQQPYSDLFEGISPP